MSKLARLKASIEGLEKVLASRWSSSKGVDQEALSSWEGFLTKNNLLDWRKEDPELRSSLVTELLSYPLTLAKYASHVRGGVKTVHVVGARAEATLPVLYWAQTLRELSQESLTLRFFGLDVPAKLHKTEDSTTIAGRTLNRSFLAEPYRVPGDKPDLIVLFNPGIAHEKLRKAWWPTVQSIMSAQRPVLITGLHQHDAQSDFELVSTFPNKTLVAPTLNPFAANKEFADGLTGRVARANMYMWSVQS